MALVVRDIKNQVGVLKALHITGGLVVSRCNPAEPEDNTLWHFGDEVAIQTTSNQNCVTEDNISSMPSPHFAEVLPDPIDLFIYLGRKAIHLRSERVENLLEIRLLIFGRTMHTEIIPPVCYRP